ncbi:MAG: hypothetical protein ABIA76_05170, partial [Candidatus Diapherotrites archaeon]
EFVIEFTPAQVTDELGWYSVKQNYFEVKMKNKISNALEIEKAEISSENIYPMDALRMGNWIKEELEGRILDSEEEQEFEFLSVLSAEASQLEESISSEGVLVVEFTDNISSWPMELPFTVTVSSQQEAREGDCLTVEPVQWNANIFGGTARNNEVKLINNCYNDLGEPIPIKHIKAELQWQSNPMGAVTLNLMSDSTGENGYVLLEKNMPEEILFEIGEEEEAFGALEFSPIGMENFGQTAKFVVSFEAELGGENPPRINGSNPITAQIDLIDLKKCISIDEGDEANDGLIEIKHDEDEATLTIDFTGEGTATTGTSTTTPGTTTTTPTTGTTTTGNATASYCNKLKFDIEFCKDDPNCAGGVEGGIDVMLGARAFKANNLSDSVTATVKRGGEEIPGLYGMTLYAKVHGKGAYQKIAELDALAHPRTRDWMFLDKYYYEIYAENPEIDENSSIDFNQDTFYLTNKKYIEQVKVKADYCSWGKRAGKNWLGIRHDCKNYHKTEFFPDYALMAQGTLQAERAIEKMGYTYTGEIYPKINLIFPKKIENSIELEEETIEGIKAYLDRDSNLFLEELEIEDNIDADAKGKVIGQKVKLLIDNTRLETEEPFYGILNILFQHDIHSDKKHQGNANAFCRNGNFETYDISPKPGGGDCYNKSGFPVTEGNLHTEKFHIKIKTKEELPELPEQSSEVVSCEMGIKRGITGIDAMPKVNWTWDWSEINKEFCDAKINSKEINYCDATQLTIEITKKLNALYGFLKANSFNLGCPESLTEDELEKEYEVESGKIGISKITAMPSSTSAAIEIELTNNSSSPQTIDLNILEGMQANEYHDTETIFTETLQAGATKTVSKTYSGLAQGTHSVTAFIITENDSIDYSVVSVEFTIGSSQGTASQENCWLEKTTALKSGMPGIIHFIRAKDNVKWTSEVQDAIDLQKLVKFNAFLIKDGYSSDFKQDFAEYYANQEFLGSDIYFLNLENDLGLKDLFLEDKISFENDAGANALSSPGIYLISVEAEFGDSWDFFDEDEAIVNVKIDLHKLRDPTPNNPFYYLPLDGMVGISETGMERTGYGTAYSIVEGEEPIKFTSDLITVPDIGSNPIAMVDTEKVTEFTELTSNPATTGNLLSLNQGTGNINLKYSPSVATPIMMKIEASRTDDAFSVYFKLIEGSTTITNAPNLSFWTGAGKCLDFSGLSVREKFLYSKDRKATQSDERNTSNWSSSYALDWDAINYGGKEFIYSILYTSPDNTYSFAVEDAQVKSSGSGYGNTVSISGSSGIDSVEEIFELIEQEKVCVSQSGGTASYWWNPNYVLGQSGLWNEIQGIDAEEGDCIG